jgi:cytochrome c peroxidase
MHKTLARRFAAYRRQLTILEVLSFACALTLIAAFGSSRTAAQARLSALPIATLPTSDNSTNPERAGLGRLLFWDPILSGQKDVACATCHHPSFGYADGLDLAIGVNGVGLGAGRTFAAGHRSQPVKRNSQSLLNVAFNGLTAETPLDPAGAPMFWDMRVRSLEAQALEPIKASDEMRGSGYAEDGAVATVIARLQAVPEYRRLFARAFGGARPVNEQNLGRALAAFQRTLVAGNSPFDRYMRGDTSAMTPEEVRGMERFQSIGCINCHSGPMFSDFAAHVLGVPDNRKLSESDAGVNRSYAFRTPTLRNLSATGPYMHNGTFATLPQVIDFYQRISRGRGRRGGRDGQRAEPINAQVSRDQIDVLARQLNMRGRGQRDLLAFLRALDDADFDRAIPQRVPSALPVGGRVAQ